MHSPNGKSLWRALNNWTLRKKNGKKTIFLLKIRISLKTGLNYGNMLLSQRNTIHYKLIRIYEIKVFGILFSPSTLKQIEMCNLIMLVSSYRSK